MKLFEKEEKIKCFVRLKTSRWLDRRSLNEKKSLIFLRRKSDGFHILEEDARNISADEVFLNIVNLYDCDDGIYSVVTCDESYDYESGYLDSYNYRLIKGGPIDQPPPPCDYCDEDGRVETDNNGPIGDCPICFGTKNIKRKINE